MTAPVRNYDPVTQGDYYSMKALFDPLVLRPVELATAEERFARGRAVEEYENGKAKLEESISRLIEPYRARLYEERLKMLPPEVQPAIRKPEKERTAQEQKIFEDYFPILRIDPPKIKEIMPAGEAREYDSHNYSMKWLHRLGVTSETYRRASSAGSAVTSAGERIDPDDVQLSAPEAVDFSSKPDRIKRLYGIGEKETDDFGHTRGLARVNLTEGRVTTRP